MHKYFHHIGDFMRDTVHLSPLEECFYRRAIDWYYLHEKPLPKETQQVFRRLRANNPEEIQAVQNILADFFVEENDGWRHKRCDAEIASYKKNGDASRENGKKGGRPPKAKPAKTQQESQTEPENNPAETQQVILGCENETQSKGNPEPLTLNPNIKTHTLNAGEAGEDGFDDPPEILSGDELTPNQILDLWQPKPALLAQHLKFALFKGQLTNDFLNQVLLKFNAQYEHQVLSENKKYTKLAGWLKDEQVKQERAALAEQRKAGRPAAQKTDLHPNKQWQNQPAPDYAAELDDGLKSQDKSKVLL